MALKLLEFLEKIKIDTFLIQINPIGEHWIKR